MKTKTLVLVGVGVVALYLLTRGKTANAAGASTTIGSDGKPSGTINPFTGLPIGGGYAGAAGASQPGYSLAPEVTVEPPMTLKQRWDNFWYGGD